jgi:hypothetical protein
MKRKEVYDRVLWAIEGMLPIVGNLEDDIDPMIAFHIGELMGLCTKVKMELEKTNDEKRMQ